MPTVQINTLVILVILDALVSTVGVLLILHYARTRRRLPTIAGIIKALSGPFESLGLDGLIVAGLIYVAVSALKFLSAYWLWNMRSDGAVLQLILLGVSAIFWYGFMLPYGPLLGIPQIILIVLAWPDLK